MYIVVMATVAYLRNYDLTGYTGQVINWSVN